MPMCTHYHCRCMAAEYRSRQADDAERRGDHAGAARLTNEAVECHREMVECRLSPKKEEEES